MKGLLLFVLLLALVPSTYSTENYLLSSQANGYQVVLRFSQTSPMEGENPVEIAITDARSQPVKGAAVKVEYFMPSLPGRAPMMEHATTAKPNGEIYNATLDLTMKGEWRVTVTIAQGRKKATVTFPFELR